MVNLAVEAFRQCLQMINPLTLGVLFVAYPASVLLMIAASVVPPFAGRRVFWSIALANATLCYWLASDAAGSDDRLGLGALISIVVVALFLVSFAIGATIDAFRRQEKDTPNFWADIAFALFIAAPLPLAVLFPFGLFARWPGALVFSLIACLAATSITLPFLARSTRPTGRRLDRARLTILTLGVTVTFSLAIAALSAKAVWSQAERVAGGNLFCLQSGDHPVATLLDASILTFRERHYGGFGPRHLKNHGLLVVEFATGRQVYNWSYRHAEFRPDSLTDTADPTSRPQIHCIPQ